MMFKRYFVSVVFTIGIPSLAHAQGSITLFGLLDEGVTFASNVNGQRYFGTQSSIQAPNRIGVKGTEDIGGGYQALFVMDGSPSLDDGTESGDGIFSRESYVGFVTPYATVTFGKQFDFMYESLTLDRWGEKLALQSLYHFANGPFSGLDTPLGTFDYSRTTGGAASPNVVKVTSGLPGGFNAGAMYGFQGDSTGTNSGHVLSFGGGYAGGPLHVDAAYTRSTQTATDAATTADIQNFGVATRYDIHKLTLDAMYTNTHNMRNGARVDTFEAGVMYAFMPDLVGYVQYTYMKGNDVLTDNSADLIGATLDYQLSKNTDVYVNGIYEHAHGGEEAYADISGAPDASNSANQTIVRIGMRHMF